MTHSRQGTMHDPQPAGARAQLQQGRQRQLLHACAAVPAALPQPRLGIIFRDVLLLLQFEAVQAAGGRCQRSLRGVAGSGWRGEAAGATALVLGRALLLTRSVHRSSRASSQQLLMPAGLLTSGAATAAIADMPRELPTRARRLRCSSASARNWMGAAAPAREPSRRTGAAACDGRSVVQCWGTFEMKSDALAKPNWWLEIRGGE